MKLAARTVKDLRAADRPRVFFDSELKGFGIRCRPGGAASWIVEYRPGAGGRGVAKRRLALGSVAHLDAPAARKMARDVLADVRRGEDPAAGRRKAREAPNMIELSTRHAEEMRLRWKPTTRVLFESCWRLHILPEIGKLKARDLTRADLARMHRKIAEEHPVTANRCVNLVRQCLNWAAEIGEVPEGHNPATKVTRYKESGRERYLSLEELERLGRAIDEAETIGIEWAKAAGRPSKHRVKTPEKQRTTITPHAAAAIRLLVLTGARLREILHLRWEHVDLGRGLLELPDSKTGKKTIVLSGAALAIIADLDKVGAYVIAGVDPEKPRSDLNRPWALVCRAAGLSGVRLHDLRHTFASFGAGGGLGLPVIGGLLGHASPKTTQRYAHLANDPLRRAADVIAGGIDAAMKGAWASVAAHD